MQPTIRNWASPWRARPGLHRVLSLKKSPRCISRNFPPLNPWACGAQRNNSQPGHAKPRVSRKLRCGLTQFRPRAASNFSFGSIHKRRERQRTERRRRGIWLCVASALGGPGVLEEVFFAASTHKPPRHKDTRIPLRLCGCLRGDAIRPTANYWCGHLGGREPRLPAQVSSHRSLDRAALPEQFHLL